MGLFSFLNKNKQESAAPDSGYYSSTDDDAVAARARSKRASSAGEPAARRKEGKTPVDPVLPEKKRARRRLVGAIALALAVAVGLPMILDSEPKPLAGDIDIRIPSKDKVAPQALPRPVAAAEALDKREEIVDEPPVSPAPAPATIPAPRRVTEVKPPVKPEAKLARAEPKPVEKPVVKPPQKAEEKAAIVKLPERDKPLERVVERTPEKGTEKLAEKNADKVAEKSADKASEKSAEKSGEKPEKAPEAARALSILEGKTDDDAGQKHVVQVAALATQEKVTELQDKLKDAGIRSYTQKVPTQAGERIRVLVGPYSKEEAAKVRAKLGKLGLSGSMVRG